MSRTVPGDRLGTERVGQENEGRGGAVVWARHLKLQSLFARKLTGVTEAIAIN